MITRIESIRSFPYICSALCKQILPTLRAETLERVCIETVEGGSMTKDLALLVGPDQKWETTQEFLASIDNNLKKAMA